MIDFRIGTKNSVTRKKEKCKMNYTKMQILRCISSCIFQLKKKENICSGISYEAYVLLKVRM